MVKSNSHIKPYNLFLCAYKSNIVLCSFLLLLFICSSMCFFITFNWTARLLKFQRALPFSFSIYVFLSLYRNPMHSAQCTNAISSWQIFSVYMCCVLWKSVQTKLAARKNTSFFRNKLYKFEQIVAILCPFFEAFKNQFTTEKRFKWHSNICIVKSHLAYKKHSDFWAGPNKNRDFPHSFYTYTHSHDSNRCAIRLTNWKLSTI